MVSPDEGAMNRNMYFSSVLGCNLGMFYKRRDYTRVVKDRKSTRLNSSHSDRSRMPSSA